MYTYSGRELRAAAGCSNTDMKNWVRRGLVNRPLEPVGPGKARRYKRANAYEFALIRQISDLGLDLVTALTGSPVLLDTDPDDRRAGIYYVWSAAKGAPPVLVSSSARLGEVFEEMSQPRPTAIHIIDANAVFDKVDQVLDEIDRRRAFQEDESPS